MTLADGVETSWSFPDSVGYRVSQLPLYASHSLSNNTPTQHIIPLENLSQQQNQLNPIWLQLMTGVCRKQQSE